MKISLSIGLVIMIAAFPPLFTHFLGSLGDSFTALVAVPFLGLTATRICTSLFHRFVVTTQRVPELPGGVWMKGGLTISRDTLGKWTVIFIGLLTMLGITGLLGFPLIASPLLVGCGCLAWIWALYVQVVAIDVRKMSRAEIETWRSPKARVRRDVNLVLSQWLTGLSTMLAVELVIFTALAIISPPKQGAWRWALLFAFAYLLVGSLLRGAAERSNRLYIDIDVVRLWKASKKTLLMAAASAGIGASIGALIGCGIWLTSNLRANGPALDILGRPITAGTVFGTIVGVLTVPRLAFVRRKELRQDDEHRRLDGTAPNW